MYRDKKSFVMKCAQLSCLLEASSPKPGNVYPFKSFREMGFSDFLFASVNVGISLIDVDRLGVGELVYRSIESTYIDTGVNVNLGVVLLVIPLAKAYYVCEDGDIRKSLQKVLASLNLSDAVWVYRAIRMLSPGGIGRSDREDIRTEPTVTLRKAMEIASDKDDIAYEYVSNYSITFDFLYPRFVKNREELNWEDAIVQTFVELLSARLDTLLIRKYGKGVAEKVKDMAKDVVEAGGVRTGEGRKKLSLLDEYLRYGKHKLNPRTSADLIASTVMLFLLKHYGRDVDDPSLGGSE